MSQLTVGTASWLVFSGRYVPAMNMSTYVSSFLEIRPTLYEFFLTL